PISAVIITLDGARRIGAVLDAVSSCAERLVLDSGSTDDTVALAAAAGARVVHQPFLGYGPQKRRAVELAAHDWVLSLDDDEVLDDEAREAIRSVDLSDPSACWAIRRRTFIGPREIRHGPWRNERVLRLFNRRTAAFKPLAVHEDVQSRRKPTLLPGSILHYSYETTADVLARSLRYAPLKAEVMRASGQGAAAWMLPLRGMAAFVRAYCLRGGWRDGGAGFTIAVARVIDSTLPRVMLLQGESRGTPPAGGDADAAVGRPVSRP
ncbi:MAG: glycosyltransferase family 2 protein, partial [Planctomycetia bacterium]|nr:glycosyltransferase family 2 protein [Planctomycetia bacterium]